ncbi:MAG: tetratricopeptide repeat protein, partial [Candidatus Marinimicrobia bacterium]|nr:tetratricopeptide repeat protein [Candidatus Neomarinimicrobiota bacterium]
VISKNHKSETTLKNRPEMIFNTKEKLIFKVYEGNEKKDGEFIWGASRNKIFDQYYDALKTYDTDWILAEMEDIIYDDPEFIDAFNKIASIEIEMKNYGIALAYYETAYDIAKEVIPKNFNGLIPWGIIENRPYLRTLHGLGICYLLTNKLSKASRIFNKILKYNPLDNQGVRALAIESYMAQGKFKNILKICSMFNDDAMVDNIYGAVYANYYLGKRKKAEELLEIAVKYSPNVAKELLKTKHTEILNDNPGYLTMGGEDEAYDYWLRTGPYWTNPELLAFLKSEFDKYK